MPVTIPDLPNNTLLLVSFRGILNGQRIITTFHYRAAGNPTAGTTYVAYLDKLYLLIAAGLQTKYLDVMPANYLLEVTRLQPIQPMRLRYTEYTVGAPGTLVDNSNTQNLALSIKRVAVTAGPKGVGRVQIPVAAENVLAGEIDMGGPLWANAGIFGVEMIAVQTTVSPGMTWNPCLPAQNGTNTGDWDLFEFGLEQTARTMHRRTVGLGE